MLWHFRCCCVLICGMEVGGRRRFEEQVVFSVTMKVWTRYYDLKKWKGRWRWSGCFCDGLVWWCIWSHSNSRFHYYCAYFSQYWPRMTWWYYHLLLWRYEDAEQEVIKAMLNLSRDDYATMFLYTVLRYRNKVISFSRFSWEVSVTKLVLPDTIVKDWSKCADGDRTP